MHTDSTVDIPDYPILSLRGEIETGLSRNDLLAVEAAPGSGKSTLVPLFLLDAGWRSGERSGGKILLLQPRRAAVRAIAARLRELAGEAKSVGYITRDQHSVPKEADIIVMTEGILTRKLLEDPELGEASAVLFDEFHERSVHSDLAYVLARQCRELFRPDLRLMIMSATLDDIGGGEAGGSALRAEGKAAGLPGASREDNNFVRIHAEGRLFPRTVEYRPERSGRDIAGYGAEICAELMSGGRRSGILFFLPGEAEIRRAAAALAGQAEPLKRKDTARPHQSRTPADRVGALPEGVEVFPLYGRLSPEEQRRAIAPPPAGKRKIVIATNVAETSLTIEGIDCVVDSGLQRKVLWDSDTGLERLETVRISAASAEQRAGRAGRTGPGRVVRLWEERERLEAHEAPEIERAELSGLFLSLAVWGDPEGASSRWPAPPPEEAKREALALLAELGALDDRLVPTKRGRLMAKLPLAPRLASMLLVAAAAGEESLQTAAFTAAILEHGDPLSPREARVYGADLLHRIELLEKGTRTFNKGAGGRIQKEAGRLKKLLSAARENGAGSEGRSEPPPESSGRSQSPSPGTGPGLLLASAYPDRIARRVHGSREYLLASGVQARLSEGERGFSPEWIIAASLHRRGSGGTIHLAAELTEAEVKALASQRAADEWRLDIDEGAEINARKIRRIGRIVMSETPAPPEKIGAGGELLVRKIRERGTDGIALLPWTKRSEQLRRRLEFLRSVRGDPWPDLSDEALLRRLEEWLLPFTGSSIGKQSLKKIPLGEALLSLVPWAERSRLDELAPEQFRLPSGSNTRLRYEGGSCILSARIQQLFGLRQSPRLAGVPIEIELLSPAGRPVQITRDLASFWSKTYPQVRKELRGRYPKHHWPEDPHHAEATDRARPKNRM